MLSYGFTGTRAINEDSEVIVDRVLNRLPIPDRVVTGACVGIDQYVSRWYAEHLSVPQIVFVPGDRSRVNPDFVLEMLENPLVLVHFMPRNSTYRDRNVKIVENSTKLIGFPEYRESHPKSTRSGTWQTIRLARPKMFVDITVLSESGSH